MNQYENDLLNIACYGPTLGDRKKARRALERFYGTDGKATPNPWQEVKPTRTHSRVVTRHYRPDGSLERERWEETITE